MTLSGTFMLLITYYVAYQCLDEAMPAEHVTRISIAFLDVSCMVIGYIRIQIDESNITISSSKKLRKLEELEVGKFSSLRLKSLLLSLCLMGTYINLLLIKLDYKNILCYIFKANKISESLELRK